MSLSADSIGELEWSVISVPTAFRVIDNSSPNMSFTTDASRTDWDATTHQNQTQGLWSRAEADYHINILELLSVKLVLGSLLGSVSNQHIRIMCDNMIAISYIDAMGGCRNKECYAITKEIWLWAIKGHNWLSAAHQPGWLNATADSQSRHFEVGIEWELYCSLFEKICGSLVCPRLTYWLVEPTIKLVLPRSSHAYLLSCIPCIPYFLMHTILPLMHTMWMLSLWFVHSSLIVRFSPLLPGRMPSEAWSGASNCNRHRTTLGNTDMVHQASESPGGCAQNLSSNQQGAVSSSTWRCSPSESEIVTSGIQRVRTQFIEWNIPSEVANVLMSSWRPAMRKQYDVHIRKWCALSLQKKADLLH